MVFLVQKEDLISLRPIFFTREMQDGMIGIWNAWIFFLLGSNPEKRGEENTGAGFLLVTISLRFFTQLRMFCRNAIPNCLREEESLLWVVICSLCRKVILLKVKSPGFTSWEAIRHDVFPPKRWIVCSVTLDTTKNGPIIRLGNRNVLALIW